MRTLLQRIPAESPLLSVTEFGKVFSKCAHAVRHEIVKIEVAQEFDESGDPSYDAFMNGRIAESLKLIPEVLQEECELHAFLGRNGKLFQRLRLVKIPLTKYLEWELETYRWSACLGQVISIVDITQEELGRRFLAINDCILFDRTNLLVNFYDENGAFRGGWHTQQKELVDECIAATSALRSLSVPLGVFLQKHKRLELSK